MTDRYRDMSDEDKARLQREEREERQRAQLNVLGSWWPISGDVLFVDAGETPATFLKRSDGVCMLYPGAVNGLYGETETGKSWLAQVACAEALNAGKAVLYVDFESTAGKVTQRLLLLGVSADALRRRFHYVRPTEPLNLNGERIAAWTALLSERMPDVTVVDGVTDGMTVHGWEIGSNKDYAEFNRIVLRPPADIGSAVGVVDHVTKNRENRGRFAIGAQHKLACIDGAAFNITIVRPFVRGREGVSCITLTKDRPGLVRDRCEGTRSDQFGTFRLSPHPGTSDRLVWSLNPPEQWRPTNVMQAIVDYLGKCPEKTASKTAIEADVSARHDTVRAAIDVLEQDGTVVVTPGGGRGRPTTVTLAEPQP